MAEGVHYPSENDEACACVHFDRYVCANERYGRSRSPSEWDACDCTCHDDYDDEDDEDLAALLDTR